ncbi:MAG: neutral zinc metallopeptidase [Cyanobacteriota bacterium]
MRWADGRRSTNVEDRRGGGGRALAAGGIGLGTLLLAAVVGLLGGDPGVVLQQAAEVPRGGGPVGGRSGAGDRQADFVSVVLADTEDTWTDQFRRLGRTYVPPKLVLFDGVVASACGRAQAAMGQGLLEVIARCSLAPSSPAA